MRHRDGGLSDCFLLVVSHAGTEHLSVQDAPVVIAEGEPRPVIVKKLGAADAGVVGVKGRDPVTRRVARYKQPVSRYYDLESKT